MATQREHKEKITVVQKRIEDLDRNIQDLEGQIEAAQAVKNKLINESVELGGVPDTDMANVEIYRLRSKMEDGKQVQEGLRARLDQALEEYRGHLVERALQDVEKVKKEIEETLQLIQNYRIELARLFMNLSGSDAYGTSMNSPKELRTSPITYEYSHVPVPQAITVDSPPLNYNPADFRRLERSIQESLKSLRAIAKMSNDQVLELAKKSEDS